MIEPVAGIETVISLQDNFTRSTFNIRSKDFQNNRIINLVDRYQSCILFSLCEKLLMFQIADHISPAEFFPNHI